MAMRTLALSAILVVGLALGVWLLLCEGRDEPRPAEPGVRSTADFQVVEAPDRDAELADVVSRLARLEASVEDIQRSLAGLRETRVPVGTTPDAVRPVSVVKQDEPGDPLASRGRAAIAALQEIALDPRRSTLDRVLATAELFQIELRNGTKGARTTEIADALIGLLEAESDAGTRRLICFNTLEVTQPWHVPVLVRVLQQDEDAAVRAQAADTLQHHLEDPTVRATLQHASRADPSEEVRRTATEMLERWKP